MKVEEKLFEEIEIPDGITASLDNDELVMKEDTNEVRRKLIPVIKVKIENNKIIIKSEKNTKRERKLFGTFKAHIKNMIKGLTEGFKYELRVANVHFPMSVSFDENKNELIVKNFLGEKKDRSIKLIPGVKVNVQKDVIEIKSPDIEKAGQAAANIEKGTKVRKKDRRVFQDGIFITEKPGRSFV